MVLAAPPTPDTRGKPEGGPAASGRTCCVCTAPQVSRFRRRGYEYWRCRRCGLTSTYPLPSLGQIAQHYREKFEAGNYEVLAQSAEQYLPVYQGLADMLKAALASTSVGSLHNARVLDIGCFTGEFLAVLAQSGADVFGLELQPRAVEIARKRFAGRIFQADVANHSLPGAGYEIVTLLGVLEHVVNPVELLRNTCELLRPGGLLMLQTPDSDSIPAAIMGRWWPPYTPVEHIHLFSRRAIRHLLGGLNMGNIRVRPHCKRLPIGYVHAMLRDFQPELHSFLNPMMRSLPRRAHHARLPFYAGEMVVTAVKQAGPAQTAGAA